MNSDPSVRQAVKSTVEVGAVLDASAKENGDGGEIVVWSDIANPESITSLQAPYLLKQGWLVVMAVESNIWCSSRCCRDTCFDLCRKWRQWIVVGRPLQILSLMTALAVVASLK